jgi:hypothetical protein
MTCGVYLKNNTYSMQHKSFCELLMFLHFLALRIVWLPTVYGGAGIPHIHKYFYILISKGRERQPKISAVDLLLTPGTSGTKSTAPYH